MGKKNLIEEIETLAGGEMPMAGLAALAKGDIANAFLSAVPGGIEAQEKAGQAKMIAELAYLPREMWPDRSAFETLGFTFGDEWDAIFIQAELPKGWTMIPTSHSMWSVILDETGKERVDVFYKAAFYDRRADMAIKAEGRPKP